MSLEDMFKRPGAKEIGMEPYKDVPLPRVPEEGAIVLQSDGRHFLALINGVSHRIGEKEARKLQAFLIKHLENLDEQP